MLIVNKSKSPLSITITSEYTLCINVTYGRQRFSCRIKGKGESLTRNGFETCSCPSSQPAPLFLLLLKCVTIKKLNFQQWNIRNIQQNITQQNFVLDQITRVYPLHWHFMHHLISHCQRLKTTVFITPNYLSVARKLSAKLLLEFSRPAHRASPFRSSS